MDQLFVETVVTLSNEVDLGELMYERWLTKRPICDLVVKSEVDTLYNNAREAGEADGTLTGDLGRRHASFRSTKSRREAQTKSGQSGTCAISIPILR